MLNRVLPLLSLTSYTTNCPAYPSACAGGIHVQLIGNGFPLKCDCLHRMQRQCIINIIWISTITKRLKQLPCIYATQVWGWPTLCARRDLDHQDRCGSFSCSMHSTTES